MHATGLPAATTLTIVVATHNGARFLAAQLASLLAQSRLPDEIIVSDDHSTDATLAILHDFAARSPVPVVVLRNVPALGFANNFLAAAARATSDIVAFCDQDDVWHPEKIATCLAYFTNPEVVMVAHRANLVDATGAIIGAFDQNIRATGTIAPLHYDLWSTFWGFSLLFRKGILDVSSGIRRFADYIDPDKPISHDRWITFLAQLVGSIVVLEDRLVDYRQHENNLYGFGTSRRVKETRTHMVRIASAYLEATRRMREIVDELDHRSEALFPLFDRDKARAFVSTGLYQQEFRNRSYRQGPVRAILTICVETLRGGYRGAHDGQTRYRSALKDIKVALKKRGRARG